MDLQDSSNEVRSVIECRVAALGDYLAATELRARMALEMGSDFDGRSQDWRTKFSAYFGGKQSAGNEQLFLAYDGETPIGCALVSIPDEYRRYCFGIANAHVNAVYVEPAYRRRGIALGFREGREMELDL